MHIFTTIYCTELEQQQPLPPDAYGDPAEVLYAIADRLEKLPREWVSIYEGRNRVLPIDEER